VPAHGSITVTVRVGGPATAAAVAARTGWALTTRSDSEPQDANYTRYVGVPNPDGDVQAAHLADFDRRLAESGWKGERLANGVVMSGQTNPIAAAALLIRATSKQAIEKIKSPEPADPDDAEFVGTCFALRHSNAFLAAAHWVSAGHEGLFVYAPAAPPLMPPYEAVDVRLHPNADLAVVKLDDKAWPEGVDPFVEIARTPAFGTEFMAYGFPEDAPAPSAPNRGPIARAFRGYVQRTLHYERAPYGYAAAEMSMPSPAGLSGGALFLASNFNQALGVAAENVQSTTYVGRFEETSEDGVVVRQIERDIVQYGIAILLDPLIRWVDEVIPVIARLP
jgi:hypothetical protein